MVPILDSPRISWKWKVLHGFYWVMALVGILLVLAARGHYTIDILVAYYITTRLWWIYHSLANAREFRVSHLFYKLRNRTTVLTLTSGDVVW